MPMNQSQLCPVALKRGAVYEHELDNRCIWCGKKDGVFIPRKGGNEVFNSINQAQAQTTRG